MRKLLALLLLLSFFYARGQSLDTVTTKQPEASDSAAKFYFISQRETLAIHNGRVFYGYPGVLDDAFFPEDGWKNGSVLYDGIWYDSIPIMYDIYKDELLVMHPNYTVVRLISERVQQFYFDEQTFVRLNADQNKVFKSGFYQRLVEGNITVFARRYKKIEEKINDNKVERRFIAFNQYYVLKDGNYYAVNKQKTLLQLVKDSRQNILQHLSQQGLKYKRNKEETISQIAGFYNQSHK